MTAKVKFKLRSIPRPLLPLTVAEKRAVGRDFSADPWRVGEGAKFFTPERVAAMAAENDALRKRRKV